MKTPTKSSLSRFLIPNFDGTGVNPIDGCRHAHSGKEFREIALLGCTEPAAYPRASQSRRHGHPASPQPPDTITFKNHVVANDGNVLRLALSDQHAVKGILVQPGQEAGTDSVLGRNGQNLKPLMFHLD